MRIRVPSELLNVMRELGADPVNMPMGEVYSALAKGILDGVVAPTDTLRALYFAEVARFYTPLAVPRGAYPARAMGHDRWQRLTSEQRAVLDASIPVWEAALAEENRRALEEGRQFGLEQGIEEIPIAAEEQARFDALYAAEATRNAAALARYGIDGEAILAQARASIVADGRIECAEVVGAAPRIFSQGLFDDA
jgi:TRAP-type C4-dicarboxylate transport system substrate-binding protein